MANFQQTLNRIETSQKFSYLIAVIAISGLTLLWIVDIKVESDRSSGQEVSDRLR